MIDAAAQAHLVTPAGLALRASARLPSAALGAVHLATIAMATDQHLGPAAPGTKQPRGRSIGVVAIFARGRMPWTRSHPGEIIRLYLVLLHGVGRGADANCDVGIGAVPAFR